MKNRRIPLLAIFTLCALLCSAESEIKTHAFGSLLSTGKLELSVDNKTGVTDLLTYSCATGTEFAADHVYGTRISIVLAQSTGTVVTTKVDELTGFQITSLPASKNDSVKVYLSKDGVDFGSPLSGTNITYYSSGTIDVSIPRGNYYIKIVNKNGKVKCSMSTIEYYLDHCNCFEYIP